jgi:MFS family permease
MSKTTDNSELAGEITPSNSAVLDTTETKDEVAGGTEGSIEKGPEEVDEPKSLRFNMTITFLCIISLLASIDSVIVAVCLSAISADLKTTSVESFWVGTSFLLAQTVTIPIYGALSEIFGRKPAVLTAVSIFLLASILCATAKSGTWLVAARSLQGVGAGGMLSLVQVITSDITTMRERAKYQALSAFAWAIGVTAAVSPEVQCNIRIMLINIPLCVIPIVGLYWSLNLQIDTSSLKSKLARVDYVGLTLFSGASTAFLIGLTAGGTIHSWSSGRTIAPIVLGLALYAVFVIVEWKFSKAPMMPLRIFRDRTGNTGFLGAFFHGLILWCYIYYIVIFVCIPHLVACLNSSPSIIVSHG